MASKTHLKDLVRTFYLSYDPSHVRRVFEVFGLDWHYLSEMIDDLEDEEIQEKVEELEALEEPE